MGLMKKYLDLRPDEDGPGYIVAFACGNCGKTTRVVIPKGTPTAEVYAECPKCGCSVLRKKWQ